jgi:hypothetical protein
MRKFPPRTTLLLLCITILLGSSGIFAEDATNIPDPNDRFSCTKIPTIVDGLEYDKTLKCETKDAICYIMEGFAMSCVPKLPFPKIEEN